MFDTLTDRLERRFQEAPLHEASSTPSRWTTHWAEIRTALLEADVSVGGGRRSARPGAANGRCPRRFMKSLTPAQQVVKVVDEELTVTLGGEHRPVHPVAQARPAVVMMLPGCRAPARRRACAKLAMHAERQGQAPAVGGRRPRAARRRRAAPDARARDRRPGVVRGARPGQGSPRAASEGGRAQRAPTSSSSTPRAGCTSTPT